MEVWDKRNLLDEFNRIIDYGDEEDPYYDPSYDGTGYYFGLPIDGSNDDIDDFGDF